MAQFLSTALLGFVLGVRHATDPDHVVAVTTIVSREKSLRAASLVGALWGVGHTLTIMLVGGAIILFGIVFPARVGLTMEFSVALMLVILGVMNVLGFKADVKNIRNGHSHSGHSIRPDAPRKSLPPAGRLDRHAAVRSLFFGPHCAVPVLPAM